MTQTMSALNVTPAADPGRWPDIAAVPRCPFRGAVARALFTRNAGPAAGSRDRPRRRRVRGG